MESFSERLIELRKERGISQAKLAAEIGVSCGIICYWETGRSDPSGHNIVKLSDFFGVTADYLLGRTDY